LDFYECVPTKSPSAAHFLVWVFSCAQHGMGKNNCQFYHKILEFEWKAFVCQSDCFLEIGSVVSP